MGYRRLLLVDDDMEPTTPETAVTTLGLLDRFDFVGAHTEGYPDDSVIGHIARGAGVIQYSFITGQYLGLRSTVRQTFFPPIYNEDLVFLILQLRGGLAARSGRVRQLVPEPGGSLVRRAISQEPGEVHFEGCTWAALGGGFDSLSEEAFWSEVLDFRVRCLRDLLSKPPIASSQVATRIIRAVRSFTQTLRPQDFVDFYASYQALSERWIELQESIR
jgi:hypothetical protein